jgi:uncharacterized membrane protein YphA (DoxX/SURF4 family)
MVALVQGGMDLAKRTDPTAGTWVAGLLAVAAGIALLAGFLTPVAAALVGIGATGTLISMVPGHRPDLFSSKLSVALLAIVAAAVVLLGPGAFSFDARLFGLRELIIPPSRTARSNAASHDRGISH